MDYIRLVQVLAADYLQVICKPSASHLSNNLAIIRAGVSTSAPLPSLPVSELSTYVLVLRY